MLNDKKGFTLLELLIALGIMTVGFLAIAQMQFLSLKQTRKAEIGTTATNIIQFISDTDMAEVRRLYLLNSAAFNNSVAGRIPDFSYCDGAAPPNCPNTPCEDPCSGCPAQPCDVMEALTVGQIPNAAIPVIINEKIATDTISSRTVKPLVFIKPSMKLISR